MLNKGSYVENICLPQKWKSGMIGLITSNLSYQKSCCLPIGAMTAIYLLEKANLKNSQNVLVHEASGSVGTYALQIASQKGSSIRGVCCTSNFEMVR
jgi:alcohol dehydrogenase